MCVCVFVSVSSYDLDEVALLSELNGEPAPVAPARSTEESLLSLDDLPAEALALLEESATESTSAAELLHLSGSPASAAASAVPTFAQLNGDVDEGVDLWTITSARGVYNEPGGISIGNIPSEAELVIERYDYVSKTDKNGKAEQTQWGYGYLTKPEGFGGWAGENACGWFVLQRLTAKSSENGSKKSNVPNHPPKCPSQTDAKAKLARQAIFKQGSYIKDGAVAAAITKKGCPAFMNYDPASGTPVGPAPRISSGVYSGKKALGVVPSGSAQSTKIDGFGVQFVTKDGKYAMVKYPRLDPVNPGYSRFFVAANCVEFDSAAIKAANDIINKEEEKNAPAKAKEAAKKAKELEEEAKKAQDKASDDKSKKANKKNGGKKNKKSKNGSKKGKGKKGGAKKSGAAGKRAGAADKKADPKKPKGPKGKGTDKRRGVRTAQV